MSVIYYTESTPITSSSGNVTNATATATLTSSPGRLAYINGFSITGSGATTGAAVQATVTGVVGGTMTYNILVPTGVVQPVQYNIQYPMPIPASGVNTNIVVSVPAFGAGSTSAAVVTYGFLK